MRKKKLENDISEECNYWIVKKMRCKSLKIAACCVVKAKNSNKNIAASQNDEKHRESREISREQRFLRSILSLNLF